MNLLNRIKVWKPLSNYGSIPSTCIDMSNWDGCLFLMVNGSSGKTSTGYIRVLQSTANSTSGAWASTFTNKMLIGPTTNKIMVIDVVKPLRRYLKLKVSACTGLTIIPITYSGRQVGSTELMNVVRATSNQPSGIHICTS